MGRSKWNRTAWIWTATILCILLAASDMCSGIGMAAISLNPKARFVEIPEKQSTRPDRREQSFRRAMEILISTPAQVSYAVFGLAQLVVGAWLLLGVVKLMAFKSVKLLRAGLVVALLKNWIALLAFLGFVFFYFVPPDRFANASIISLSFMFLGFAIFAVVASLPAIPLVMLGHAEKILLD